VVAGGGLVGGFWGGLGGMGIGQLGLYFFGGVNSYFG
jgi:hypothetical protein